MQLEGGKNKIVYTSLNVSRWWIIKCLHEKIIQIRFNITNPSLFLYSIGKNYIQRLIVFIIY